MLTAHCDWFVRRSTGAADISSGRAPTSTSSPVGISQHCKGPSTLRTRTRADPSLYSVNAASSRSVRSIE